MTKVGVIGLGYVGLPLVEGAASAGFEVVGVDSSSQVVSSLNSGKSLVDDIPDRTIDSLLRRGFRATTDNRHLRGMDVVAICVPTPLAEGGGPDLASVRAASEAIRDNIAPGLLVVLESTSWPGTTEELVRPILEESGLKAGVDFNLAFSPERIDPGNPMFNLRNTPKIVGGYTSECRDRASAFYAAFVERIVPAKGTKEAEMAKLLENTYRQVNIALVNEMAKFSRELGIDIWDVIECASTKPFGFQAFYPGPGVGGHCIPIDPSYLSHQVQAKLGYPFRFVELAQEVNRSMPQYVAGRAADILNNESKPVRGANVLLLGVTYKPGVADQRESPAIPLAEELLRRGAHIHYYDPFVREWVVGGQRLRRVGDLAASVDRADLVIHLQCHSEYAGEFLGSQGTPVLDTRGRLTGESIEAL